MSHGELATAVGAAVDPTSLMQRVADRTLELITSAEGVAIGLSTGEHITYVCGAGPHVSPVGARVSAASSLSGLAATTGRIQISDDTQRDTRVDAVACRNLNVASLVCIPLVSANETYGVLAVNASRSSAFTDSDVAVLQRLADFVSVAVGSACDLHRATSQLLELCQPNALPDGPAGTAESAGASKPFGESTSRYMMSVLDPAVVDRIDARTRIQDALDHPSALRMVGQPIIDLMSGAVLAVEMLARFERAPVRTPDLWFEDAHRVGLGVELEIEAIERALRLLPELPNHVAITINVGPETIVSPHLRGAIDVATANRIVIELTEHTAFHRYPDLQPKLMRLRRHGVRLAVDDAGSGYSSLTHILQLAPDFIKLDRELISGVDVDPVRRALVTSLVAFAHDTGAQIVAEGVESGEELEALRRLGVRYAQGFFIGRPAALDELVLERIVADLVTTRPR